MDTPPYFSIILTTHNRSSLVKRAINSVLTQSFTNFELIVINDNSQDNTMNILNSIVDHNVTIINNSSNQGMNESRNIGLNIAKGKYVLYLDDDDEFTKNAFKKIHITTVNNCKYKIFTYSMIMENNKLTDYSVSKKELLTYELALCKLNNRGDRYYIFNKNVMKKIDPKSRGLSIFMLELLTKYDALEFPIVVYKVHRMHKYKRMSDYTHQLKTIRNKIYYSKKLLMLFGEDIKMLCLKDYIKILNYIALNYMIMGDKGQARKYLKYALTSYKNIHTMVLYLLCSIPTKLFIIFNIIRENIGYINR